MNFFNRLFCFNLNKRVLDKNLLSWMRKGYLNHKNYAIKQEYDTFKILKLLV